MSCVTVERLRFQSNPLEDDSEYVVSLDNPARLKASNGEPSGFHLDFNHIFAVTESAHPRFSARWHVSARMYAFSLLDYDHRELLAYHWEPGPRYLGPDIPHIHVSAPLNMKVDAITNCHIDLDKLHVVTGYVSIAAVVRMLITEFNVAPLRHDWSATLDRVETLLRNDAVRS